MTTGKSVNVLSSHLWLLQLLQIKAWFLLWNSKNCFFNECLVNFFFSKSSSKNQCLLIQIMWDQFFPVKLPQIVCTNSRNTIKSVEINGKTNCAAQSWHHLVFRKMSPFWMKYYYKFFNVFFSWNMRQMYSNGKHSVVGNLTTISAGGSLRMRCRIRNSFKSPVHWW